MQRTQTLDKRKEGQKGGKKKNNQRKSAEDMLKEREIVLFLTEEINKGENRIPAIFKYTLPNASCAWVIWRRVQVAVVSYSEAITLNAIQLGSVQLCYAPCVTYGNCWVMIVIFTDQNSL